MPWNETCCVSERMKLVADYLEGRASMSALCMHYGVSRRVAYKWVARFREEGVDGLKDRSRAPNHSPHKLSADMVNALVKAKKQHPCWGPKKIVAWLETKEPSRQWPAPSTAARWLERYGLVERRRARAKTPPFSAPLAHASEPNDVWCADYKGPFKTLDDVYCYPLTLSDANSRYLLACRGLPDTRARNARPWFDRAFSRYGLPRAIRTDNGPPFVSKAPLGLSHLSVWWHELGIRHERIAPGHPEQNGRHERMHLTLKLETARPPARDMTSQQRRFDVFVDEFNRERPHEALGMMPPSVKYTPSPRQLPSQTPDFQYPADYRVRTVHENGRFRWPGRHVILVGAPLAGKHVGCKQIDDLLWEVYWRKLLLGYIDVTRIEAGLLKL